jgi:hypothetical protein
MTNVNMNVGGIPKMPRQLQLTHEDVNFFGIENSSAVHDAYFKEGALGSAR